MKDRLTLTNPEAARPLTDPKELRLLEPFMTHERTLSEAAKMLGLKLNAMHYHVKRFVTLGLLEVVRQEPRAGRATKVYRATADEFLVPFNITPFESLETLCRTMLAVNHASFLHNFTKTLLTQTDQWGVYVQSQAEGALVRFGPMQAEQVGSQHFLRPDLPALWLSEGQFALSFARAKELQGELHALLEKYGSDSSSEQRYVFSLRLAPVEAS